MSQRLGRAAILLLLLALALAGCDRTAHRTLAEQGAVLIDTRTLSPSPYNSFACTSCHAERASDAGDRILPGAPLEGAALRPSWWGGAVLDLDVAVSDCLERFMQAERLDLASDDAQAILAHIEALAATAPPAQTAAVAFTVPIAIGDVDIAAADATRGRALYERACASCHGAVHTGQGRLSALVSLLPDDTFAAHGEEYSPACLRLVFIEKVRHGNFLGYAGRMPPFSTEVLSDAQLADVLRYLGVPVDPGPCIP